MSQAAAVTLTALDVESLLRDESPESRIAVVEKISSQYNSGVFQEREYAVAEQIFRLLTKDIEVRVRESLARSIKENDHLPRDIVLTLARDVDRVALPVLEASTVLSEADLIELVETSRETSKLVAISKRPHVTERVADALIESSYPQVVTSLLGNATAAISETGYGRILDQFSQDKEVTGAMAQRASLPVSAVEKLISHVSSTIAQQLESKYGVAAGQLQGNVRQSREDTTLSLLSAISNAQEIEGLVKQMHEGGRLTPSILLTALCRGHLEFFETGLGTLAGIATDNAKRLINDKGTLGFRALYDRIGLPESLFDASRLVLSVAREMQGGEEKPGTVHYANRMVEHLLTEANEQEVDNLPYMIALVRQA